jgi:two-component system KDP operon response regulator KdpE
MRLAIENRYTVTLDDDPSTQFLIEATTGLRSIPFTDPHDLIAQSAQYRPMAVFIDLHLAPSIAGIDFIPPIRKLWPDAPILVVTVDTADDAVSRALANGASDFIVKPLRSKELLARLQVRVAEAERRLALRQIRLGDIAIDTLTRTVSSKDKDILISPMALALLLALVRNRGMMVKKEQLKVEAWGNTKVTENALNRRVFEIRQALQFLNSNLSVESTYGRGFSLLPKRRSRKGMRAI